VVHEERPTRKCEPAKKKDVNIHLLVPDGVDDVSGRDLQPREMNWRVGLKDCVNNNEIGQWTR
jgi:hypothetical protein